MQCGSFFVAAISSRYNGRTVSIYSGLMKSSAMTFNMQPRQKTNAHYVMKIFLGKRSQSFIGRIVSYASYQSDDPHNCDPSHLPATKISCDSTPSSICFATFCKAGRCFSAACSMVMALAIYTKFRQPITRCSLRMGTAIEAIFSS